MSSHWSYRPPWPRFCLLALAAGLLAARADQAIYTDSLQNGWANWSWSDTINLANTSPVHSGSDSISVQVTAWGALYVHNTAFSPSSYTNFSFWINGGASGGQLLRVQASLNGAAFNAGISIGPLGTSWQLVNAPMSTLVPAGQSQMDGLWIEDRSGTTQPPFYVDDMALQSGPPLPVTNNAPVAVQVDALAGRHPISPLIYGVAFAASNDLATLNFTLNRSGGNAETSYNWQLNAHNHAADWYFESIDDGDATPGATADTFVANSLHGGAQPAFDLAGATVAGGAQPDVSEHQMSGVIHGIPSASAPRSRPSMSCPGLSGACATASGGQRWVFPTSSPGRRTVCPRESARSRWGTGRDSPCYLCAPA